ncbi:fumarylacetoacetate hydrolase family protein [Pseudooceanicola sp. LIPI14-2-Ac024]|uniref:fumarylacetoacetate hydrolase family protein n=1 Tax=Pseudooceanicola sp. LIPI14-2-Ac024 TaxID=3344875 RepID=UPI0035CF680D
MKFLRYGEPGAEKPGVLDTDGQIRDLSGVVPDLTGAILAAPPAFDIDSLPLVEGQPRLGIPVAGVGKMICIGLNYSDHAAESGMPIPEEPIVFMKATSALIGPNDTVVLPRGSQKGDWEVELGVVIGREAKYVSEAEALSHVAGYTIVNDVSERHFQSERGGQWTKGKSCDTFGPVGPWVVTPDEVADPQNLALSCDVNGQRRQTGSTAAMIFGVAHVISYLSQMMRLEPGDIIATGTPPGVGMGMKPQQFLKAGDVMELSVQGLGTQRQEVRAD